MNRMKRYVVMKGGLVSMNHLPAKESRGEAEAEVARLEAVRAENNAKVEAFRNSGHHFRGASFIHRMDNDPWSVGEV